MIEQLQWQPTAPIKNLLVRAKMMAEIRQFFSDRGVLEVETPILSEFGVTDVNLSTFSTEFIAPFGSQINNDLNSEDNDEQSEQQKSSKTLWLNTSPEYAMKRLLAAGSGAIFQLCKVFRNEEAGQRHNPEFTMLEWYRPHFDMYRLINEVDDLLQQILDCEPAEKLSYQFVFQEYVGLDPLSASQAELVAKAKEQHFICDENEDRDVLLQFLFTALVEPKIGQARPVAIYHFPASQAALAQISSENHLVAERFEFYYKGLELANGFHELADAREQLARFQQDNRTRQALGLPQHKIDRRLLAALQAGIPDTSGVALGVDRLMMIALGTESIEQVMSFSIKNA